MEKTTLQMNEFGKNLSTRAFADEIFLPLKEGADLIVDFKDVEEASPSFCHEMLVVLQNRKARANFSNVNNTIRTQISKARSILTHE